MFGVTVSDSVGGNRAGVCVAKGEARFRDMRVAEIEPLVPTAP